MSVKTYPEPTAPETLKDIRPLGKAALGVTTYPTPAGVTLPIAESDVTSLVTDLGLKAALASPALTGSPTAPTQAATDNSTKLATDAFAVGADRVAALGLAPGQTVTYPTPTVTDSSAIHSGDAAGGDLTGTLPNPTLAAAGGGAAGPLGSATVSPIVTVDAKGRVTALSSATIAIPESAVTNLTTDLAAKAPLASPALTGSPTATTAAATDNSTRIATDQFVVGQNFTAGVLARAGVQSYPPTLDATTLVGTVPIADLPTGTGASNVPVGGVIAGAGPTGDASHTLALTYNAAGQLTAVTNNAIAIANTAVSGLGTMSTVNSPAPIANGGTGQTSKAAGFDALSPATTKGDLPGYSTTGVRVAVGATGTALMADTTAAAGLSYVGSSLIFGNGVDGALAFDGTSAVAGFSLASTVYTQTRDVYASSITISGTCSGIKTADWRLFCSGVLDATVSAFISNDGNAAVTTSGGTGTNSGSPGSVNDNTIGGGGNAGAAGTAGGARTRSLGGSGGAGGLATGGGTGGGVAGGVATLQSEVLGGVPRNAMMALQSGPTAQPIASSSSFFGGAGGSGGTAATGTGVGGGGGASGGLVAVFARVVQVETGITLTIRALGGAGGQGTAGTSANVGGGGGGGGGAVMLVYTIQNIIGTLTLSVTGGSGGAPRGTGATGATGSTGNTYQFQI